MSSSSSCSSSLRVLNTQITQKLIPYWNRALQRITPQNVAATTSFFNNTIVAQMAIPFASFSEQQAFLKEEGRDRKIMKRAYHNLHHVFELCELYDGELRPRFEAHHHHHHQHRLPPQDDIIFLVAFFHDVIYDAKKGDNEEESDQIWKKFLENVKEETATNVDKEELQNISNEVSRIILATKSHLKWKPDAGTCSEQEILNTQVFLDMDLAILGAPLLRYQEYATQIKIEYQHVDPKGFCEGRMKFLSGMINNNRTSAAADEGSNSSSLFFTDVVREMRHKQMVENLSWEMETLTKELEDLKEIVA